MKYLLQAQHSAALQEEELKTMKAIIVAICALTLSPPAIAGETSAVGADKPDSVLLSSNALDNTSRLNKSGILELSGRNHADGRAFHLRVLKNGYVTGTIDRKPVSFWIPRDVRDRAVLRAAGTAMQDSEDRVDASLPK